MDFSFLKNFGQMIGGAAKKGFNKLGEMGGDDEDSGGGADSGNGGLRGMIMNAARPKPMPMTPGFNPNASMPSLKAPMMAGGDSGLINRRESMPNQMPQLMPPNAPQIEPIRDSVDIRGQAPQGLGRYTPSPVDPQASTQIPLRDVPSPKGREGFFLPGAVGSRPNQGLAGVGQQSAPMVGKFTPPPDERRQDVPIPQLPGHHGEPIPYNEIDAGKYDHVMSKMGHSEDGRHETGVRRGIKDVLLNGVLAANKGYQDAGGFRNPHAWAAALSGGAAGAIGTGVNPQAGREFQFDTAYRPEIEDRMQRQQQSEDHGLMTRGKMAGIEHTEAQTRRINKPTPPPGYADAGWGTYNRATGKPEYIRPGGVSPTAAPRRYRVGDDLVDETGKVVYKGTPRPSAEQRPMTVSPGSTVIDPKTGKEIYKAPPKAAGMSKEATKALTGANAAKRQADSLYRRAGAEKDPDKRAALQAQADDAREEANNLHAGAAEMHPDEIEAGEGDGGWWYSKPKGSSATIQRKSGGAQGGGGGTAKLSDLVNQHLRKK